MRDELNDYGIKNPDGVSEVIDSKATFDNEKTDFIKENALSDVKESAFVPETYDDTKGGGRADEEEKSSDVDLSSESSSASSSMASGSASVGGGLGALTGAVAAGVAAAVTVVAVFLSTLAISLSLVMASMYSLVLEVKITGAEEEDFVTPIYATLTGEDGAYQEQLIGPDTLILTFDDLQPGTRYHVTVKNEEKVFFESDYFTSTTPNEKGEIESRIDGKDVFVTVQNASLKSTEHYTIVAKDADGNIVYQVDGIEPFLEYHFTVDPPKDLFFYLMVGGKTYAVDSILLPEYDFENGVWAWGEDRLTATVTFADKNGGESLVLEATITRKTIDATCEEDGAVVYTARVDYNGRTFTDKQSTAIPSLGHDYEGVIGEDGQTTYVCSRCGDTYTD